MTTLHRTRDKTPLYLIAAMCAMWLLLHLALGSSPYGPTVYNTYTRQALAWRQGLLHLPEDVPHLELAIFEGKYYVSFPALPSVVLLPLTYLFGINTPDALLVKLYALGACLLMYRALKRAGYQRWAAAGLSFLVCFSSSLLPMTLDGAVWYHAQVLAFFLTMAAVCLLTMDMPTLSLLCYALSVACRPFNALYGLPLFFTWFSLYRRNGISWKNAVKPLIPGICLGLAVAFGIGLYNYVRFGNPLEFGHNYLPEFSFQGGIQFSIRHVANHLKTFLWGWPVYWEDGVLKVRQFGYSMLLACPTLTLMLAQGIIDLVKHQTRWEKAVVFLTCVLHAFFLLFHRTMGGFQLGARYAVDLIPYTFLFLLLTPEKKRVHWAEWAFLGACFLFTLWGVTVVHI
ncbi:MAG: hypothetical protein IKH57_16185 [Clostridia bacterium]|nr:hypothetical protein [Clostridia bacterium]